MGLYFKVCRFDKNKIELKLKIKYHNSSPTFTTKLVDNDYSLKVCGILLRNWDVLMLQSTFNM